MKRVLLFWRVGYYDIYTYVTKIDDDYIIPPNASGVIFYEGIIVKNSRDVSKLIIDLPNTGQTLAYDSHHQFKVIE